MYGTTHQSAGEKYNKTQNADAIVSTTSANQSILIVTVEDKKLPWNSREGCIAPAIAAAAAGLVLYIVFFHPFLTYSQRNRVGVNYLAFASATFVAGFLVGIVARAHPFLASLC